jgi:hypothetical protein
MDGRRWVLAVGWMSVGVALAQDGPFLSGPARAGSHEVQPQTPVQFTVSGGVASFTGALGDRVAAGPFWAVTGETDPARTASLEVSYEGARSALDGRYANGNVTHSGLSAVAKLGARFGIAKPYLGAGLALGYLHVDEVARGMLQSDLFQQLPLVAGVDAFPGRFTVGVRTTYRVLFNDEFAALGGEQPGGGLFSAAVNVGGRF